MRIYVLRKRVLLITLCIVIVVVGVLFSIVMWNRDIVGVFLTQKRLPIYSVETKDKKIAISFDAAWGDEFTDDILDILDEHKIKTTFFLVAFWIDKYPDMAKKIHERGHEIGNHSTTHPHMSRLSKEQIANELKTTGDKIEEITGKDPVVFRPPFGDYNNLLIETAEELGYSTIQWDLDSLDWKELGVQPVVDRITRNVKKGSIVLFHNNAKHVSEFLPLVLEKLQEQDYEIVPVSELIYKKDYYIDNTGRQRKK